MLDRLKRAWAALRGEREIVFVDDVKRLHIEPDDVLVISTEHHLSDEACHRIKSQFEAMFAGHKGLVLTNGMRLGVVAVGDTKWRKAADEMASRIAVEVAGGTGPASRAMKSRGVNIPKGPRA